MPKSQSDREFDRDSGIQKYKTGIRFSVSLLSVSDRLTVRLTFFCSCVELLVKPTLHQCRLTRGTEREARNTRREIIEEFEYDGQGRVPWGVINVKFHTCVHTVGIDAFFSHRSLRKVVLNEGLVRISGTYKNCNCVCRIKLLFVYLFFVLTFILTICIQLNAYVTSSSNLFLEGSFWGCNSIERICFPSSVTEVDDRAFANCSSLTEVSLNEGIEKIAVSAFHNCSTRLCFKIPSISRRLETIIQTCQTEIEDKINELTGVEMRSGELLVSAEAMQAGANWGTIKASVGRIAQLISYYEMREATTIVELALWKVKIDQAEENLANRDACRIDVPGPVKETILQYL